MPGSRHTALVRRLNEAVFGGSLPDLAACAAEDVVDHGALPGQPPGRAGLAAVAEGLRAAFPDLEYHEQMLLGEGDRVAALFAVTGTHRGPFLGLAPSGRRFAVTGAALYRIAGGRVVERWAAWDLAGLLRQLALPPPAAAPRTDPPGAAAEAPAGRAA